MSNSRAASAMAGTRPLGASTSTAARKTFFEQQRELLLGEIAMVLANINKLNRSLEAVVGNEFSAVEALWSQFESVMAKEPEPEPAVGGEGDDQEHGEAQQGEEEHEHEHEQPEDDEDDEAATQLREEEAAAATVDRGRSRGDKMDFDY
ncbi:Dolichyl-diphosphooligosaccharide-protein glycosyltransferase subunit dad1 [Sporothrix bragantina]|uniref:DASH complex subunit DAD1 n=1 Tax=Sporothrix bragantina TaxID=671064 RepID=A0ABP0BIU6_9PEZI